MVKINSIQNTLDNKKCGIQLSGIQINTVFQNDFDGEIKTEDDMETDAASNEVKTEETDQVKVKEEDETKVRILSTFSYLKSWVVLYLVCFCILIEMIIKTLVNQE